MLNDEWVRFGKAVCMGRHWGRHGWRGALWGEWPGERRMRRGDVKYMILELLAERPRHGYDVIRDLEERQPGYRPSPGSIYPTLALLEDGGYVTSETSDGKRVYAISDEGRKLLTERTDTVGEGGDDDERHNALHELRANAFRLGAAVLQVARESDPATIARLREILERTRREIYGLLAEPPADAKDS
ncbi:MAG: PadR family transcriptional regulator [Candidatus Baltobacteraceae bacterium]